MPSWQFHILKTIFRVRRIINPPTGVLDVEKNRIETEALATYFGIKIDIACRQVSANQVQAEWITTPNTSTDNVILYLHGGGYNSGSIKSHRSLAANIANSAKARALIIDYRLAPENPFPAAVDDTITAYRWLLDGQISPDQIVVAGDSCGGAMAISLLISLRDANEPMPAATVCLSPWTDLTCTGESWETNAKKDIFLDPGSLSQAAQVYLGGADPRTPLASPLFADLRGLPPVLIQVGSDELILSDATCLAERAQDAGVDVILEIWEGMQHEWHFTTKYLPEARQAIDRIGEYIEDHLGKV
jgi:acetyl esterase/lipase